MDKEEILFNELYEKTKDFGRTQFIKLLISKERENIKLKQQVKKQKEVIDKIDKYINNYDVFKVFSFPLMKRWEEQQIKSSIDYEFKTSLIKDLKDILKEVSE